MMIHSTAIEIKPIEQIGNKIYIRTDIQWVEEIDEITGDKYYFWKYDEISMPIEEYQQMIKNEVDGLKNADLDNKLALTEIYEMLT